MIFSVTAFCSTYIAASVALSAGVSVAVAIGVGILAALACNELIAHLMGGAK